MYDEGAIHILSSITNNFSIIISCNLFIFIKLMYGTGNKCWIYIFYNKKILNYFQKCKPHVYG
jgi:hypothetical protein